MPNPTGKNGYGEKIVPSDEALEAALRRYAAQNLKLEVRIANLKSDLNYSIRLTKLKALNKQFKIPTVRKAPPVEVARQAIIDKVVMDVTQQNGPNYFKTLLQQEGIMVPRDTIRQIMREHFPLGFENRFPGNKKSPIPRTALMLKLGKQALDMGDIGLPIYGYKDKWSDDIPLMSFVPNSRTAAAIGHLFLDFIEAAGGISIQMTMDKGSEIGWQYVIQDTFRTTFAPDIDPEVYPVCRLIKSVHNTIIEAFWRWLKDKLGRNLKEFILIGKRERIFSPDIDFHVSLFYWIFIPLLQAKLDEFRLWWNHHRVRVQIEKNMPSGHVPADAFAHPKNFGGIDCRISVPQAAVDDMRQMLTEEVGSRESHLSWFTLEFAELAEQVYLHIGKPTLSLETAWGVFQQMAQPIADVIEL
ncbi:hypothetical protein R3P38DRAFT_3103542 [Favolaschia claudopus]|uniref:Integrase core domain-containing protein n=1 Tax=Favolaschia claudopus TaxID=2862362 RepID=A0AAV9ZKF1_9AGAR